MNHLNITAHIEYFESLTTAIVLLLYFYWYLKSIS